MERENSFSQAMLADAIKTNITSALKEDLGKSDLTSNLLKKNIKGQVQIKTKEKGVLCGKAWVDECFKQIDKNIKFTLDIFFNKFDVISDLPKSSSNADVMFFFMASTNIACEKLSSLSI